MAKTTLKGYRLDFANNALVMNYTFAAEANKYGTPEYVLVKKVLRDFPTMTLTTQSGRQQKKPKYNKRLTYKNIKKHLSTYSNAEKLLDRFEEVKVASATAKSPYKFVTDWFKKQCPDYTSANCNRFAELTLVSVPETEQEIAA